MQIPKGMQEGMNACTPAITCPSNVFFAFKKYSSISCDSGDVRRGQVATPSTYLPFTKHLPHEQSGPTKIPVWQSASEIQAEAIKASRRPECGDSIHAELSCSNLDLGPGIALGSLS